MLRRGTLALAVGLLAFVAPVKEALAGYSLFGDAEIVSPGNASIRAVQIRSTCPGGSAVCFVNNTFTFGGVDFDIPAGLTFANFLTLATDHKFTDGSCGGGAPRFQLNMQGGTDTGNIFVYLGPPPGYVGCPMNVYQSSGDLLEGIQTIDTGQLDGGGPYDPYSAALIKYGSYQVTGVQLVTDSSWFPPAGSPQTMHADNVDINGTIYTFDEPQTKEECKKSGWEVVTRTDGSEFRNQGDCVSYFNTGR
jgi:hypothetical protein